MDLSNFVAESNEILRALASRHCRVCGCTELVACLWGCCWVEEDLCSSCVDVVDANESPWLAVA